MDPLLRGEAIVDLLAGTYASSATTPLYPPDGTEASEDNLNYLFDTKTGYVRVAAEWDFIWPLPPLTHVNHDPSREYVTPWPPPVDPSAPPSVQMTQKTLAHWAMYTLARLDANIARAKANGLRVLVYSLGAPQWVNASTNKFALPPDSALIPASPFRNGGPPNGKSWQRYDLMWSKWIHFLMLRYHPGSPNAKGIKARLPTPITNIDYLEVVNEPNAQASPAAIGTPRDLSTALMMTTAQYLNNYLNPLYTQLLPVFAPAVADVRNGYDYRRFTTTLINRWLKPGVPFRQPSPTTGKPGKTVKTYKFSPTDPMFAWSHHNYNDVETIATQVNRLGPLLLAAILILPHPEIIFALYYGQATQDVRNLLRGGGTAQPSGPSWWQGYPRTDVQPAIWLTEGGARLDQLPPAPSPAGIADPNTDYTTNPPTDPVATQKQWQSFALAGAAHALNQMTAAGQAGQGVEMFTNFLFYDNILHNLSGLCDQYSSMRIRPAPNETAHEYKRLGFEAWVLYGTYTPYEGASPPGGEPPPPY